MPTNRPFVSTVIVSVFFGLAAGVTGMLVVIAYVVPTSMFGGSASPLVGGKAVTDKRVDEAPLPAALAATRSSAIFYVAKPVAAGTFAAAYVPEEAVGAGAVLTSDGWLMSHAAVLVRPKGAKPLVAVIGTKAYPVADVIRDPYSDVVFTKIDAANLPVTAFGEGRALQPGESAFAFDAAGGLRRLAVIAFDDLPAADVASLVRSSERMQKVLRVSGASGVPTGAMILNRQGEVVGILDGKDGDDAVAVPLESVSRMIGGVLREKRVSRPSLGLRYVDLSRLIGASSDLPRRGALVSASVDGKTPAVDRRGPADLVGIAAGDVITAVAGQEVSAKATLADLVAEYAPGTTVAVTFMRGGAEKTVDVVLGTAAMR
jgi:S1-C subfamily serine protease